MTERKTVTIRVYGQEYSIVSSEEPTTTQAYAEYIDGIMRQIAGSSGATDTGRVAILALLQVVHELFSLKEDTEADNEEYETRMVKLLRDIDSSMNKRGLQTDIIPTNPALEGD
jgi:cell division protein ZapA